MQLEVTDLVLRKRVIKARRFIGSLARTVILAKQ